jgi:hypothetical protein
LQGSYAAFTTLGGDAALSDATVVGRTRFARLDNTSKP